MAKTLEDAKKELKEKFGDEFIITGNFISYTKKVGITHTKCGREFEETMSHFLNDGRGFCKCCKQDEKEKTKQNKPKRKHKVHNLSEFLHFSCFCNISFNFLFSCLL